MPLQRKSGKSDAQAIPVTAGNLDGQVAGVTMLINPLMAEQSFQPALTNRRRSSGVATIFLGNLARRISFPVFRN